MMSLYIAHTLATFCERGWEFAVGLFILEVFPDTLLPVAIYGIIEGATKTLCGSHAGAYIDRTDRMPAVSRALLVQNAGNALSSLMNFLMIYLNVGNKKTMISTCNATWSQLGDCSQQTPGVVIDGASCSCQSEQAFHAHDYFLLFLVIAFGSTAAVGNVAAKIAIQRDWAKVLYIDDSTGLAKFNAIMKAIELTGLILAPILVGVVSDLAGIQSAAILIPCLYAAAYLPEIFFLRNVYNANPGLQMQKETATEGEEETLQETTQEEADSSQAKKSDGLKEHWRTYFDQDCWPPAFCLGMLYFTVLSFGTLMTGYLKWCGMGNTEQSGFRAIGAVAGVMASLVFPFLMKHLRLPLMGLVGSYSQLACLFIMSLARFAIPSALGWEIGGPNKNWSLYIFTTFLAISRFGLWGFDLAVSQILQEQVDSSVIGTVNGVQGSIQEGFQIVMYVLTLVITDPADFWILVSAAVANVGLASLLYTCWYCKVANDPIWDRAKNPETDLAGDNEEEISESTEMAALVDAEEAGMSKHEEAFASSEDENAVLSKNMS